MPKIFNPNPLQGAFSYMLDTWYMKYKTAISAGKQLGAKKEELKDDVCKLLEGVEDGIAQTRKENSELRKENEELMRRLEKLSK